MKEIYEKLYDVTNEQFPDNQKLNFSKLAFSALTDRNDKNFDLISILHLENEDFLEASYMAYFNRLPDKNAIKHWSSKMCLEKKKFQKVLTKSLINSLEFRLKRTKVINNIYDDANILQIVIRDSKNINKVIEKLYVGYSITIKPLKVKIKHLIR